MGTVNLGLVDSLNMEDFVLAIRRFAARGGIVLVILCYILFISACIYIFIYLFIYLGFSFTIVLYVCYLLWNYFMCIWLYMIMCMLLSATSTHFKWELMLYCLHCPTVNKVFLLFVLFSSMPTTVYHDKAKIFSVLIWTLYNISTHRVFRGNLLPTRAYKSPW